jgi:hypothetical protein
MRARRLVAVLPGVIAVAVLTGACRAELDLNVAVEPDGSGTVEVVAAFDDAALERIGGDLGTVLALDDLALAGWQVSGPELEGDGMTRVRVERAFVDPDDAAVAFGEVAGATGPLQGFAVRRERSLTRTTWGFEGTVDLTEGLAPFVDAELVEALGAERIGDALDELERRWAAAADGFAGLRVAVRLPGEVRSNATTTLPDGAVWEVPLGTGPLELSATGSRHRLLEPALAAAGAVLVVVALLWPAVRRLSRRTTEPATGPDGPDGGAEDAEDAEDAGTR